MIVSHVVAKTKHTLEIFIIVGRLTWPSACSRPAQLKRNIVIILHECQNVSRGSRWEGDGSMGVRDGCSRQ